ncbi:MAG: tryptophan 7-halogenase [bacterium]
MQRADVVVAGGGPAGLAAALRYAADGAAVVVVERGAPDRPRLGETLGAEVAGRLAGLGLDPTPFFAWAPRFVGVHSAWGGPDLVASSTLLHPLGEGWHVDRGRFDAALLAAALDRGVRVVHGAGRCQIFSDSDGFQVMCADAPGVAAPRVVDASGRGAPASAGLEGRRWVSLDRQVALLAIVADPGGEPVLQLEAVEAGYWYTAPLPGGRLAVVLVTDGDVLTDAGADRADRFSRLLAGAPHTRARVGAAATGPLAAGRSDSGWLVAPPIAGFEAVGDAAQAADPLGGDGVTRALGALEPAAAWRAGPLSWHGPGTTWPRGAGRWRRSGPGGGLDPAVEAGRPGDGSADAGAGHARSAGEAPRPQRSGLAAAGGRAGAGRCSSSRRRPMWRWPRPGRSPRSVTGGCWRACSGSVAWGCWGGAPSGADLGDRGRLVAPLRGHGHRCGHGGPAEETEGAETEGAEIVGGRSAPTSARKNARRALQAPLGSQR